MKQKLGLVMLAAGNSRRFGSNKLLALIEGEPMYCHILGELMQVKETLERQGLDCGITVVTQYDEIAEAAGEIGARVLYNLHPDEGISSSLKIGLKGMPKPVCLQFPISPGFEVRRFLR